MSVGKLYTDNTIVGMEDYDRKFLEDMLFVSNWIHDIKWILHDEDKGWDHVLIENPTKTLKKKHGVCFELCGAMAHIWKNIIKSDVPCYGIFQGIISPKNPPTRLVGHSDFVIEKSKTECFLFTPLSRNTRIIKYNGINALYKTLYSEIVSISTSALIFGANNRSYPSVLFDKIKNTDFSSYDCFLSKYDATDKSLYDKYNATQFGSIVAKKYGKIDSSKLNLEKIEVKETTIV